jgi:hypothetical protein
MTVTMKIRVVWQNLPTFLMVLLLPSSVKTVKDISFILLPFIIKSVRYKTVGRDSSVGIATGYGLDGPGIESRWKVRFSAPV